MNIPDFVHSYGISLLIDEYSDPPWKPSKNGNTLVVEIKASEPITLSDDALNTWVHRSPGLWWCINARSTARITVTAAVPSHIEARAYEFEGVQPPQSQSDCGGK